MTEETTEPTVEETQFPPEVEADPQGIPASETAETPPVDDETAAEAKAAEDAIAEVANEEPATLAEPAPKSEPLPDAFQTPAVKAMLETFPDVSVELHEVMGDGLVQVVVSRGDDTAREVRRKTVMQADALEGPILDLAGRMGAKVKE